MFNIHYFSKETAVTPTPSVLRNTYIASLVCYSDREIVRKVYGPVKGKELGKNEKKQGDKEIF